LSISFINNFFKGHKRSVRAKKHIIASFFIKGVSILVSLALVPLTLHYLDPTKYGIWITLSSVLAWFSFFDIGLGHGLRNKFAEALARDNKDLARAYVSTTYVALVLIIGTVYLLFLFINPFLNWTKILNTAPELVEELSTLVIVVFSFFCLRFILDLIGKILLADQKPAINNSFGPAGNLIALIAVFIITKTTSGSLLYLGMIMSFTPVFVLVIASFYFFSTRYKEYIPRLKYVNFAYFKDLAGLGLQFFFIQVAAVIIFTSSNLIISQLFGPVEVTTYNIAYRYFNIITMLFIILLSPLWSAVTEAYGKQDFEWIINAIKKLLGMWVLSIFVVIGLILLADRFYLFWIGPEIKVPFILSLSMGCYIIVYLFGAIFVNIINGIGKLRVQLLIAIYELILFPLLAIAFGNILGVYGVVIARILMIIPGTLIMYIQCNKIISKQAKGILLK